MPPALFGGVRVCLAGLVLLLYLRCRGESLYLPRGELRATLLGGLLLFVGGNGLITAAMEYVPSNVAAVLAASTPLWMAVMETFWPGVERLTGRGWLGLVIGMAGVLMILGPQLEAPQTLFQDPGLLLVLGSTLCWALGSLVLRHREKAGPHLTVAAFQMVLGGGGLALVGFAIGEAQQLSAAKLTLGALGSFVYLLIVGSLVGFVAFNYLIGHVSAARVGTYAYVNPVVAILVGCSVGREELTSAVVAGMVVILVGVALVRGAGVYRVQPADRKAAPVLRSEPEPWGVAGKT
jgi:drug/metabolite transporter (DMT)-like permease